MATSKVFIEGLSEFKKYLKDTPTLETLVPSVNSAVQLVHVILERRVGELFTAPATLSSVMVGRTVAPTNLGKTFLRYGLAYNEKAIPLGDYKYTTTKSSAISKIPTRYGGPLGFVKWKEGQVSREVYTQVRKGKSRLSTKYGSDLKGFITSKRAGRGQPIFARKQRATWSDYPTKGYAGVRAPITVLYGPSLATLAMRVSEKDSQVERAIDNVAETVIKGFAKYYA